MTKFTKKQIEAVKNLRKAMTAARRTGLVLFGQPDQLVAYKRSEYEKSICFTENMDLEGKHGWGGKTTIIDYLECGPLIDCGDIGESRI